MRHQASSLSCKKKKVCVHILLHSRLPTQDRGLTNGFIIKKVSFRSCQLLKHHHWLCNRNLQENQGWLALVLRGCCVNNAVADNCAASFLGSTLWYTCTGGGCTARTLRFCLNYLCICIPIDLHLCQMPSFICPQGCSMWNCSSLHASFSLTVACLRWGWAQHCSLAAASSLLMDILEALGCLPHSESEHGSLNTDNTLFKWQLLECFLASHFNSITSVNSNI